MPSTVNMQALQNSKMEAVAKHGNTQGLTCEVPSRSPCRGYREGSLSVGYPKVSSLDGSQATYVFQSNSRMTSRERQVFFHQRSALCFYAGGPSSEGWLVGFAIVHMNVLDMQAFIGFVCFFGVALPLICLVTALLHYNKYEKCKHHVRQLRQEYQREQLAQEVSHGGDFDILDASSSVPNQANGGSSSSRASGTVQDARSQEVADARDASHSEPEMSYQPLAGEPRRAALIASLLQAISTFLRPN